MSTDNSEAGTSTSTPRGYRSACAYPLQGLPSNLTGYRCPECGRAFDPADPKTFCNTRPSRLVLWLAAPVGWTVVIIALAAAAGVMSVSRWKLSTFEPSSVDLIYYLRPLALRHQTSLVTDSDYIFTLSMLAVIAALGWWAIRLLVGMLVRWGTNSRGAHGFGRKPYVMGFAFFIAIGGAALGWPYRLAWQWTALRVAAQKGGLPWSTTVAPPTDVSTAQRRSILRAAVIELPQSAQRIAGIKLLMEQYPAVALPILSEAVTKESSSEVRSLEVRLIGMHRDANTIELLMRLMMHPDSHTRAAAADAIGILHAPSFAIPLCNSQSDVAVEGSAPVFLSRFIAAQTCGTRSSPAALPMNAFALKADVREALERMMLTATSTDQREAAARALVAWPPPQYHLRVAEWGVWLNVDRKLKYWQSAVDGVPSFVHGTGNAIAEFGDRINNISVISKPILHITVDRPLAMDVSVFIHLGRPWFAYPRPDDFSIRVKPLWAGRPITLPSALVPLDNPSVSPLAELRQGYPWIEPHHPCDGVMMPTHDYNDVTDVGLRWQSVIVSPRRLPWMTLAEVGSDPRHSWWKRLREVPSGWVSSRGETDRFLYYDGPTVAAAPVWADLVGDVLLLDPGQALIDGLNIQTRGPRRSSVHPSQGAIFIHHRDGQLSGQVVRIPLEWDRVHSVRHYVHVDDLHEDQVIDAFSAMLKSAGLTAEETGGLLGSCRKELFQTDGTRMLMIMSRADYDEACPITIRPTPTEIVRVGIILTEFK